MAKVSREFDLEVGRRLHRLRKEQRHSQASLAKLAEVSPKIISSAENGDKSMRTDNLVRIAKALDVSTDYLLTGKANSIDVNTISKMLGKMSSEQISTVKMVLGTVLDCLNVLASDEGDSGC